MKINNAKNLTLFLHDAQYEVEADTERCEIIENYLRSLSVSYKNIVLENDAGEFPFIDEFRNTIFDAILKEIVIYFSDGDLSNFNVLDPMNMPLPNDEAVTRTYGIMKFSDLNTYVETTTKEEILERAMARITAIYFNE